MCSQASSINREGCEESVAPNRYAIDSATDSWIGPLYLKLRRGYVTNPFEDENGTYHVLINDERQHSLWLTFIKVPDGWRIIHNSDSRAACIEFINQNWTDMRPKSLVERMNSSDQG